MNRVTFEPVPESAKAVRAFVRDCLPSGSGVNHGIAVLLASELASNAIVHAQAAFDVRVEVCSTWVRVSVDDPSPALPVVRPAGPADIGGRGLAMVEAMATQWGTKALPRGKRVWFQMIL